MNILLYTSSTDHTSDYITASFDGVFRFNSDLHKFYKLRMNELGVYISDPVSRVFEWNFHSPASYIWWRKPTIIDFGAGYQESSDDHRKRIEITEFTSELFRLFAMHGQVLGDTGACKLSSGKLVQMVRLNEIFSIPKWEYILNTCPSFQGPLISKVLYAVAEYNESTRFTRTVRDDRDGLENYSPCLVQQQVEAIGDLTTFICYNCSISYYRPKVGGEPLDWRESLTASEGWERVALSDFGLSEEFVLRELRHIGIEYGRIDWVVDQAKEAHFLEVNTNGQFMWMQLGVESPIVDVLRKGILSKISALEDRA